MQKLSVTATSLGLLSATRLGDSELKMFDNGQLMNTKTGLTAIGSAGRPLRIGAYQAGALAAYSYVTLAFVCGGSYLSDAEMAQLYQIVNTFIQT